METLRDSLPIRLSNEYDLPKIGIHKWSLANCLRENWLAIGLFVASVGVVGASDKIYQAFYSSNAASETTNTIQVTSWQTHYFIPEDKDTPFLTGKK